MARVRIDREDYGTGCLPPVCMVCGAATTKSVKQSFWWYPEWANILILFGLIPWVVVVLFTRKSVAIRCPVCVRHRTYWLKRSNLLFGVICFLFLASILATVVGARLTKLGPR